jgi:hypothetical protein
MEKTTVAAAVEALSFDDKNAAYEQGGRYAKSKMETLSIAQDAARTMGTNPSFDRWENYRMEWVAGHAHANPQLTGNAHDAAWADFAKLLNNLFGLTKPTSTSAAAEKKRAEREKANEELLQKYEDTPAIHLRDQLAKTYEAMAKNPENKDLKKKQKELDKVLKLKTSEENKAHGEELRSLRAQVKEAAAKCTDIEKLEAVLEILDEYTDIAYTIEDQSLFDTLDDMRMGKTHNQ